VPGINYLLASSYLHTGRNEKAYKHLLLAVNSDKDLFSEFEDIFPVDKLTRKMKRFLEGKNLIS
jgi:hypothetical protein